MDKSMNLIEELREKISLVKFLHGKMILGVAARKIYGKDEIKSKGFFVWDLDMFI